MTTKQKVLNILLVVGLIVVGLATIGSKNLGGANTLELFPVRFVNGIYAGDDAHNTRIIDKSANITTTGSIAAGSGTAIAKDLHGTCTIVSDSSIAATSTGTGTCVTTGSLAGDRVFVALATTTTKMSAQYLLSGVVAGTNTTTLTIVNLTGAAGTPGALSGWGSTTKYWIVR